MKETPIIRKEINEDIEKIFELHHIAFEQENEARLVNALRNNLDVFIPELSLISTDNNKIVGHILFTRINIKDDHGNLHESLGLAPMAVKPEVQKKGIGGKLIRKGLETAINLGFKSVIVLGHENYYPKFGFRRADNWGIKAPFDFPLNAFMAIELVRGGLDNVSGTVVYPKEFDAV